VPVDLANYKGREQAYVKHYLLDAYLEALIHKIASGYNHVVYVDGYSGPWQAAGRDYQDTSFGIALRSLRSAKEAWKKQGRDVRMTAHLVEKSKRAFRELEKLPPEFPDIEIVPHKGDFVALAPDLAARIPSSAFAFLFIDPKGWGIDIKALEALLRLPNSEVLFNFMFEFINRAASMREAATVEGLDRLILHGGWRDELATATSPDARKRILVDAFAATIGTIGGYRFVADTPVLRPVKDREIYSLVYATRKPPGIEVFRNSQAKTLEQQAIMRSAAKAEARSAATGQTEAFPFSEMAPDATKAFLAREAASARQMLLELVPTAPATITYGEVWPQVLTRHAIRKAELGRMAAAMRRSGELTISEWRPRKQVPDDAYRISRPG
jgi:three-Cys-motif partner protein